VSLRERPALLSRLRGFAINLKTAKAIGLDIPVNVLALADRVIV
jgi:hypothetical protein